MAMMAVIWRLLCIFFITVAKSSSLDRTVCSFRKCHQSFYYENQHVWSMTTALGSGSLPQKTGKPLSTKMATTSSGQTFCPIDDFRLNPNYKKLSNYRIVIVGDSLDLHSCFSFRAMTKTMPDFSKTMWNWSEPHDCFKDEHLHVSYLRISGLIHKVGESHEPYSHFQQMLTQDPPHAVIFSSMVWDILRSHDGFCEDTKLAVAATQWSKKKNAGNKNKKKGSTLSAEWTPQIDCFCNYQKMETPQCVEFANPHIFNQVDLPWCDHHFIDYWREQYLQYVQTIRLAFPQAHLFLRNQPFTSAVTLANQICLSSMNDIVREVATSLVPVEQQGASCRFLNINALLARAAGEHMGSTPDHVPRRDGLHYANMSHVWRDYVIHTVLDNAV